MTGAIDSTPPTAVNPSASRVNHLKRQQEKRQQKDFNRHLKRETGKKASVIPDGGAENDARPTGDAGASSDTAQQGRMIDITV